MPPQKQFRHLYFSSKLIRRASKPRIRDSHCVRIPFAVSKRTRDYGFRQRREGIRTSASCKRRWNKSVSRTRTTAEDACWWRGNEREDTQLLEWWPWTGPWDFERVFSLISSQGGIRVAAAGTRRKREGVRSVNIKKMSAKANFFQRESVFATRERDPFMILKKGKDLMSLKPWTFVPLKKT